MDYNSCSNNSLFMEISPTFKKTQGKKKKKKKPMKVVYISNPMKFKTSASGFRSLVQGLTGQDSEFPLDPNKVLDGLDDGDPTVLNKEDASLKEADDNNNNSSSSLDLATTVDPCPEQFEREEICGDNNEVSGIYESFDDVFVPQMMDNISNSTFFYESAYHDVLTTLDAV